jgi:hypothetical protein
VDKDHSAAGGEDKIGIARQVAAVECVAETQAMDQAPDGHFGMGVFAPHASHYGAPLGGRESVHGSEIL